jgi:hypothetical protein
MGESPVPDRPNTHSHLKHAQGLKGPWGHAEVSSVACQLAAAPFVVLARGIEHALHMAIDRLQCSDTRELDRAIVFGRLRQKVGRRQHLQYIVFGFGDDLGEVPDCVAQRREFAAILQRDRLGKTH